ncbi:hypothetical protein ABAC460_05690 [Asticcacaulis sp. AC460]|uniref:hypothetical protein n=1 Tax=Asticcacaulis sp. AC460 TaxID=1282360 RepID=UPI0003C3E20B|nr:hypothetical protein [Asticcacaulis sp. AC460]ESQ91475.1 hypothetical protein ABAC460_05690 [Asticcacaulis sp. AC460]
MRQKSHGPAEVSLAKGLSARASKADVSVHTGDENQRPALQHGRDEGNDAPRYAAVRYKRPQFYLKIDGLTGDRPPPPKPKPEPTDG